MSDGDWTWELAPKAQDDLSVFDHKSGIEPQRVRQYVDRLFQYIEVVSASKVHPHIEEAEAAIGEADPDDVLYVACALATDANIWSGGSDFDEQDVVETYSTSDVIDSLDRREPTERRRDTLAETVATDVLLLGLGQLAVAMHEPERMRPFDRGAG